jgi:hypothetical protein
MGALPQALEIFFEVKMKRIHENNNNNNKISNLQNVFFFFFYSLDLSYSQTLQLFFNFLLILNYLQCYRSIS